MEKFNQFKEFLEQSSAAKEALKPLKKGVEISINIDEGLEGAIFNSDGKVCVENRAANSPDVHFDIQEDAISSLLSCSGNDIGELAVTTLKEITKGTVKIKIPGSLFSLMRNGYLEIIKTGGKPLWNYLSEKGITNPTKIIGVFKKLKKGS